MTTQIIGMQFATRSQWRYVLFVSAALGVVQFLLSSAVAESPVWLAARGRLEEKKLVAQRIWGIKEPASAVEPLLEEGLESERSEVSNENVTIPQLFGPREYKKPLAIVCFAMLTQQISGMWTLTL
jgi:CCR4-NOT transcription complex subunit 1